MQGRSPNGLSPSLGLVLLLGLGLGAALAPERACADPPALLGARLDEAASHPRTPAGAPQVLVQLPENLDVSAPLHLVVFLHGHLSCVARYLATEPTACLVGARPLSGLGVGTAHARSRDGSILVAPQLAWLARSSDPGRFRERGFFTRFVEAVVARVVAPRLGRPLGLGSVGSITLVAHSGGYLTALRIVESGELGDRVDAVVLLDALYAGVGTFAAWAARDRHRIVSVHTAQPRTTALSAALAARLRVSIGPDEVAVDPTGSLGDAIATHRAVVARTRTPHSAVPGVHLAEILTATSGARRVSADRLPR